MKSDEFFKYQFLQTCKTIDIYPTQFGWQRVRGSRNTTILRDCYVLHVILAGEGTFYSNGKKSELGKNRAFLIRPGQTASYYGSEDNPWEYMWVGFGGDDCEAYFGKHGLFGAENTFEIADAEKLKNILLPLLTDHRVNRNTLSISATVFAFLDEFFGQVIRDTGEETESDELVRQVMHFIGKHYAEELSVTEMCEHFHISRTYLFKKFKKETGKSPQEYIIDFRMARAKDLIENTDLRFNIIAMSVGYFDYEYFCKTFIHRYGISPKQLRRNVDDAKE